MLACDGRRNSNATARSGAMGDGAAGSSSGARRWIGEVFEGQTVIAVAAKSLLTTAIGAIVIKGFATPIFCGTPRDGPGGWQETGSDSHLVTVAASDEPMGRSKVYQPRANRAASMHEVESAGNTSLHQTAPIRSRSLTRNPRQTHPYETAASQRQPFCGFAREEPRARCRAMPTPVSSIWAVAW
jgi:hypothetical protein